MIVPQKFSVIIPSQNEGLWLKKTVKSVLENTNYPDFEIIVIADFCSDGSANFLKQKKYPNVTLIETNNLKGAIETRNLGAKKAKGEFLVFIDSHEIPQNENWLLELSSLLTEEKVGAATLKIPNLEEKDRVGYFYTIKNWELEPTWKIPKNKNICQKTPSIPGGCFGIRKNLFNELGGFDVGLKKWGREDFEFSLRIWRMGYDLVFSPNAAIAHSYDRVRSFKISYEEVDYNTLRTALSLFSASGIKAVKKALQLSRPKGFSKKLQQLKRDPAFLKRKAKLNKNFKRSFESYLETFSSFLPPI